MHVGIAEAVVEADLREAAAAVAVAVCGFVVARGIGSDFGAAGGIAFSGDERCGHCW